MFYVEKNDKPTCLEKKLNLIKVQENTIILPLYEKVNKNPNKEECHQVYKNENKEKSHQIYKKENKTEKQMKKLAIKTNKIISKMSNSKKVVLSKELQKEEKYINYLNTYGLDIQNGKWLFEILLPDVTQYIINKKQLEKVRNINTYK